MAVYVDDMNLPADVPNGDKVVSSNWSHLMADTHEELMAAARALHLNPKWLQYPGTAEEHFDLTSGKRQQAIKQDVAQPITWRQSGELYAAKVQAKQADELDHQAGVAFRDGDLDQARAMLAKALIEYPERGGHWTSRLEAVEDKAQAAEDPAKELPPVGKHRDGGSTTLGTFGAFERAPEPPGPHYCPGCSAEKDGTVSGPKIEAQRDLCQGCVVDADTRSRPAPVHDLPATDRSTPDKSCAKCGAAGVGPGGIICPPCRQELEARASPGKERDEAEAGS